MLYEEKVGDLFQVPDSYYLCHCISADFMLGAGIAAIFASRLHVKKHLMEQEPGYLEKWDKQNMTHDCIRTGRVFNLVTKRRYWDKPTYWSIADALTDLKNSCIKAGIRDLAMPQIGCGLDKLSWETVSQIIKDTFNETECHIVVCRKK